MSYHKAQRCAKVLCKVSVLWPLCPASPPHHGKHRKRSLSSRVPDPEEGRRTWPPSARSTLLTSFPTSESWLWQKSENKHLILSLFASIHLAVKVKRAGEKTHPSEVFQGGRSALPKTNMACFNLEMSVSPIKCQAVLSNERAPNLSS